MYRYDFSEDALPEYNPEFQLPEPNSVECPPTLSNEDAFVWAGMVARRPQLEWLAGLMVDR